MWIHLAGGRMDGILVSVPMDAAGLPVSPVAFPAVDIPWRPQLIYERRDPDTDGLWTFDYVRAEYDGT